jgi:phosphohistidine phosphatase
MADRKRTLVLVRHAKSAWPDEVHDTERPLNKRGRRDAPATGRWLRAHVGHVDAVVCSPAARTRETWGLIAAELARAPDPIFDERVYAATAETLLAVVRGIPDDVGSALLLGHNPGVADLVTVLTGAELDMKTSALAVLGLTGSWVDAGPPARATLIAYATPRGS